MTHKTSKITITIEGGIDIDFTKDQETVEKQVLSTILEFLNKRNVSVVSISENAKLVPLFRSNSNPDEFEKQKQIKQEIELIL